MPPPRRRALLAAFALLGLLIALFRLTDDSATSQQSPRVSSAQVDGNQLSITFSERLSAESRAAAADFTVKLGGAVQPIASAALDGTRIVLTLQRALPDVDCTDASVSVGYQPAQSTLAGIGGGEIGPIDQIDVDNVTDAPPQIVSLETNAAGTAVYAQFCEPIADLSFQWSAFDAFSLRADNVPLAVHDLIRSSRDHARLEIQIARNTPIREGQQVTLGYNQSLGNEFFPLADANQDKRLVASWAPRAVTNHVDVAPTLVKASARYEVVTLTFSEDLDEASVPATEAFRIGGVQHAPSVQSVAIAGRTVGLSLSGILSGGDTNYTLSYTAPAESPLRQRDGAHQVADLYSFTFRSNTPTARPQTVSAQVDGTTLTITFDLPLKNVAPASAFTLSGANGVSVADTSFQGTVVTLMLSAAVPPGATITISYEQPNEPPRIEARNNRDAESFDSLSAANLTVAPAPQLQIAAVSADGSTLTLRFSLALDASEQGTPPTSAFMLRGTDAEITSVAVSGSTVSISLEPLADAGETITASYTPPPSPSQPQLRSRDYSQPVEAFSGQAVVNRADGKPRPTSAAVDGSLLVIMFDRMLDDAAVPDASAFILAGSAAAPAAVSIAERSLWLTLSPAATHEDILTLSYSPPTASPLKRGGRSILVDGFSVLKVENQTSDPTPAFSSARIDPTGRTLTITMSGPLLTTAAGTPAMAALAIIGSDQAAINSVAVRGSDIRLTLSPPADVGETISVSYTQPQNAGDAALRSADGRWRASSWSNQLVANLADGIPRPAAASVNGAVLTLQFDRPLESTNIPPAADFTISPIGITAGAIAIDHRTATVTLSRAVAHNEIVTISYAAATAPILSRDGQPLSVNAFAALAVRNLTPQPLLASVTGNERTIQVTFSQNLNADRVPEVSAFFLGSNQPSIMNVSIDAKRLSLTLDRALTEGAEYTLTYTAPSEAPLTTAGGDQVPTFSRAVVNNTDVAPGPLTAVGDGSTITITFDQTLDENADVPASSFQLTTDTALEVSDIDIENVTITLTLSRTLREDETASLTYTPPAVDTAGGIADPGRHRTEQFSIQVDNRTDTAPIPISGTVEDNQIAIVLDQEIYADERFDLDVQPEGYPTEHFTLRGTDAAITFVEVVVNGPGGAGQIVITLSETVHPDDVISITYFPASGTVRIHDNDASEHRAQINNYQLNNITARPPQVVSAQVDGTTLTITFDLPLKNVAPAGTFTLSGVNGVSVADTSFQGTVVTLTLSSAVPPGATITVSYEQPGEPPRIEARNNREAESFDSLRAANLTIAPAPQPQTAAVSADGSTLSLRFSLALDASEQGTPPTSAFALSGTDAKITSVVVGGSTARIALDPLADVGETITASYTPPPSASQPRLRSRDYSQHVEAFSSQAVENRADGKPRPTSATVDGLSLVVTFDRVLDASAVPDASAFTLTGSAAEPAAVSIAGRSILLTLSPAATHEDTVTLSYSPPSEVPLKRDGRSISVDGFSALKVENQTSDPTPAFSSAQIDPTGRILTITMSGPLLTTAVGTPLPSAFAILGSNQAAVDAVTVSGSDIRLTLSPPADVGETISVSYTQPQNAGDTALRSADGRWRASSWSNQPVTNHTDGIPRPIAASVNGTTLTLQFDRLLESTNIPPTADFTISPIGITAGAIVIDRRTVTMTLSRAVAHNEIVTISYAAATAPILSRDSQPLSVNAFAALAVRNLTPQPLLASVTGNERTIQVTFSQNLNADRVPEVSAFFLGSNQPSIMNVSIDAKRLSLTLDRALTEGAEYTLTYTAPSEAPLTTAGGDQVPTFSRAVVNNTDVAPNSLAAIGDGSTITITFDQTLDENADVPASSFQLAADTVLEVSDIDIEGVTLTLTLSRTLREDETASLTYTPPAVDPAGGVADPSGHRTEQFSIQVDNRTDTAPIPISGTVQDDQIVIVLDQDIYNDERFDLDVQPEGYPAEHFTLRGTDAAIIFVEVVVDGPDDAGQIVITLSETVHPDDVILITYFPVSGTVRIRDDDAGEHRVQINSYQLNNITTRPPQVVSAQVDGTTLTITFDLPLDMNIVPPISAFTLFTSESRPEARCPDPTMGSHATQSPSKTSLRPAIRSASIDDSTLTLAFDHSAVKDDDSITLTYTLPEVNAISGANGLPIAALSNISVKNLTDYAPTPISLCATTADGNLDTEFHVLFDQRLNPAGTIDTAWFTTEPYTDIRSVILVPVDGEERKLRFILEPHTPIREGQELTLTYSAPVSGGLRDDDAGNAVASFSSIVINNIDVAPQVQEIRAVDNVIKIAFDQRIDENHIPPPNCEALEELIGDYTCGKYPDIQWFTIVGEDGAQIQIDAIVIDGTAVALTLARQLLPGELIDIRYAGQSAVQGIYNLRDTSTPSNRVGGFVWLDVVSETIAMPKQAETTKPQDPEEAAPTQDPTEATKPQDPEETTPIQDPEETAPTQDPTKRVVKPVTATISRTSPDLVTIEFDGALPPTANSDHSGLSVSAGGVPISILAASTAQSTMTLRLAAAVSECAAAVVAYDMTNGALVDAANHPIESFTMKVANLIDREWALQCVRVDTGSIILSFDNEGGTPKRSGYQWELSVNGSARRFTLNESSGNVELRPTEPICAGDYIEVRYTGPESSAQLVLNRLIENSAPCAIGAWVSQLQLSVAFDSALDDTLPSASEFSINGGAEIEAVERIDGSRLELRLAPPGIHVRQSGRLRYTGTTLTGNGMTVAPFEIDVIDETAPPRLSSASAIGSHVMLRFDQPLSDVNIPASRFVLAVTEVSVSIQSTEVQGATLILTLSRALPDEPDILPVAYLAGTRGGIAGLTGVRVPDSIFIVRNLTETRPSVVSITAEARTVRISFDQRIDGASALTSDFTVMAGLRTISVASMSWANDAVTLTLIERITSLDVVLVSYQPGTGGAVRDRSGLALKAFEILADNQTPRPRSTAEKVADARLRARDGATLLERELAWEFASTDGMNFILERGTGETTVMQGEIRLTIDVAQLSEEAMRISLRRMSNLRPILEHLDAVPRRCWHADAQGDIDGLLFDLTDLRKMPLTERLQISLGGQEVVRVPGWCVLDLVIGRWSLMPFDGTISVPSLLVERPILELIEPFGGTDGA